ncbi:MAG: hypothetical protein ACR2Q3_14455 [Woeseiaceae bacterium]
MAVFARCNLATPGVGAQTYAVRILKLAAGIDSVYIDRMAVPRQKVSTTWFHSGLLLGLLFAFGPNSAFAQSGPPRMPQFEADAPKVGERLPDIAIHDDLGNPVNIRELADENYKVLILGCLT